VAGGVLCRGGEGEKAQSQVYSAKKAARGVLRAPLTVEGFTTAEAAGQRRWRARTEAQCSDSDVVSFGHGDGSVGTGVREVRRGEARAESAAQRRLRTRPVGKGQSERLLTRMGASGHRRPRQPTRALREATLPLTAGPHASAFFHIKNYSWTKIAQKK
jgi:hypothetical protein